MQGTFLKVLTDGFFTLQKKEWQKNVAQSHLFEKQHLDWILEVDTEVHPISLNLCESVNLVTWTTTYPFPKSTLILLTKRKIVT